MIKNIVWLIIYVKLVYVYKWLIFCLFYFIYVMFFLLDDKNLFKVVVNSM